VKSVDLTLSLPTWMQLPVPDHVASDAVVREELLSWQVHPDGETVSFLSLVVGDLAASQAAAGDVAVIQQASFTPVDDETFYAYVTMENRDADSALMDTLQLPGLVLVPPVVYTDEATMQVTVLGEEDTLSSVVARIHDDVSVSIERVSDHGRLGGSLAGRLTRRQFEAVEVARDLGYYAVPRTASLAEVAAELDISESAASSLLRKAEQALVDAALVR
jgi:predicted DNA binding protein